VVEQLPAANDLGAELSEAPRNVAKHSHASEVQIRVEASPAGILL
jgi:signal transduction histidine kinase